MILTETQARAISGVLTVEALCSAAPRPIIDRPHRGFAKLIVDRRTHTCWAATIVGERAVEIAQVAAVAMAADNEGGGLHTHPRVVSDVHQCPGPGSADSRLAADAERGITP